MKLVTVYTPGNWRVEAQQAIWDHWPGELSITEIDVTDFKGYERILTRHWEEGEDFAVVEPDIIIRPDVADAFINCFCVYGCFPYNWLTDVGPALGCTWFRAELLRKHPDVMRDVAKENVSWKQLDVVLMRHVLARKHNQQPHVHLPPVQHLNEAKALLPDANPEPLMSVPHW